MLQATQIGNWFGKPRSPHNEFSMFRITMLPALEGDCLWIEYGESAKPYRILIDGGPIGAEPALRVKIESLPEDQRRFELVVVTHIDSDHIAGIVKLLANPPKGLFVRECWFNGYCHLAAKGILGALEAEFLTVYLKAFEKRQPGFWNGFFKNQAAGALAHGDLPVCHLEGGMELIVLGPGSAALAALRKDWTKVIKKYHLDQAGAAEEKLASDRRYRPRPGFLGQELSLITLAGETFKQDTGAANRSSITLIARYRNKTCLLAADAWPEDLEASLSRFGPPGMRRVFDAVKVPHHGSSRNNSNPLYKRLDSRRYLISSSGARHCHPDAAAVARILVNKRDRADLFFNYKSDFNKQWEEATLEQEHSYAAHFPAEGEEGISIDLE
jgi:beta-lactamase superfamily II metal-dependent hydrolase